MPKRSDGEGGSQDKPTAPRWRGSDSLDLVYRLNERSLQAFKDWAASPEPCEVPAIARHREIWSALGADALKRAAQLPFVLLDVHFGDVAWWGRIISGAEVSEVKNGAKDCGLPEWIANPLMQETLVFAWHTVKWDQRVARLSLGMSPGVAESIAAVMPQQLATISKQHSGELRLRWQCDAEFWDDLLRTAERDDQNVLDEFHLYAKLLLCGKVVS
jgi:hypothetical protein